MQEGLQDIAIRTEARISFSWISAEMSGLLKLLNHALNEVADRVSEHAEHSDTLGCVINVGEDSWH